MKDVILHKMSDPSYLPTLEEVKTAFPLEESFPTDSQEFSWVCPNYTKHNVEFHTYQVYTQEF